MGICKRIDSRESAKRWCANRLPTKILAFWCAKYKTGPSILNFRRIDFRKGVLRVQVSAFFCTSQRAPRGPPIEDPPKSGLRVSVCSFSSLRPMKQLFGRQRPLPKKTSVCFSIGMSSSRKVLALDGCLKNPTMTRVTLLWTGPQWTGRLAVA